jgi:hypothetical protein
MERIIQYRQAIRQLLTERASSVGVALPLALQTENRSNLQPEVESQLIFDTEHAFRCWLGGTQASLQLFYPDGY